MGWSMWVPLGVGADEAEGRQTGSDGVGGGWRIGGAGRERGKRWKRKERRSYHDSCFTNYYSLCEIRVSLEFVGGGWSWVCQVQQAPLVRLDSAVRNSILVDFQTGVTIQCWSHIYTSWELNGLVHRYMHSVFMSHSQLPNWVFVLICLLLWLVIGSETMGISLASSCCN